MEYQSTIKLPINDEAAKEKAIGEAAFQKGIKNLYKRSFANGNANWK